MDNDLQDLEAELKRLRPLAPSRTVAENIARQLASPTAAPRRNAWAWAALPLAAMVAGFVLLRDQPVAPAPTRTPALAPSLTTPAPASAAAKFKPVSAENLLYAQSDEGLVTSADGTTARRYPQFLRRHHHVEGSPHPGLAEVERAAHRGAGRPGQFPVITKLKSHRSNTHEIHRPLSHSRGRPRCAFCPRCWRRTPRRRRTATRKCASSSAPATTPRIAPPPPRAHARQSA